jgi:hypothetical protein
MATQKTIYSARSPNIWYNIFLNENNIPTTGDLAFTLLKHNFGISCNIKLDVSMSDYTSAILGIVGNQVRSKSLRSTNQLQHRDRSSVFYRDTLYEDIPKYLVDMALIMSPTTETKGLLLNDLTFDAHTGDSEIKPMFRVETVGKTNEFYLDPGYAYKKLIDIIGMNLFSIDISIDDLLDELVSDIAKYYISEIIPSLRISSTPQLEEDILRYLRMVIYGI